MIRSHAVRQAPDEPGSTNTNVRLATPATARDCSADGVADDRVLGGDDGRRHRRAHHDYAARQPLADVVVRVALDDDRVDPAVGDPRRDDRADRVAIVGHDASLGDPMPSILDPFDQESARLVVLLGAAVRNGQYADIEGDELWALAGHRRTRVGRVRDGSLSVHGCSNFHDRNR